MEVNLHLNNTSDTFVQTSFMRHLLLAFLIQVSFTAFAQVDTLLPPYKRYPTLPPLQLFLADSATKYTKADLPKKKPLLLILFSPDCEHCQHEAREIVAHAEEFKDIHIIMSTTYPIYRMTAFAASYGLDKLSNVVMAKDPYYLLISFYDIKNLPFMALYNKKGDLIETMAGTVAIEKVLTAFKAN